MNVFPNKKESISLNNKIDIFLIKIFTDNSFLMPMNDTCFWLPKNLITSFPGTIAKISFFKIKGEKDYLVRPTQTIFCGERQSYRPKSKKLLEPFGNDEKFH